MSQLHSQHSQALSAAQQREHTLQMQLQACLASKPQPSASLPASSSSSISESSSAALSSLQQRYDELASRYETVNKVIPIKISSYEAQRDYDNFLV